jgi:hypothetical protein
MAIIWDGKAVQTLRDMWALGHSTREIAAALGAPGQRNAVIGKAHRIKLPRHANTMGDPKEAALRRQLADEGSRKWREERRAQLMAEHHKPKKEKPAKAEKPISIPRVPTRKTLPEGVTQTADLRYLKSQAWMPLPGSSPVKLEDLPKRGACRWPIGEDHPFLFCALSTEADHKYCAAHHLLSKPERTTNDQDSDRSKNLRHRRKPSVGAILAY